VLRALAEVFDEADVPAGLLTGLGMADDAAVLRLNRRTAVVATVDFFAPIVDDPETYGAIAAANALSDIYAMGAEAVLALNVAAFPESLPVETQQAILRGGARKVKEAGAVVAGGHTVWDDEPKYGLCVLGMASPSRLFSKGALRPGDVLFLTKPLGTGLVVSARRAGVAEPRWEQAAVEWMVRLNRHTAHLLHRLRVRAATDVTGFGLAGHAFEMAVRSKVAIRLSASALPALTGAREAATEGIRTGGAERVREWLGARLEVDVAVATPDVELALDPQTSGGLLFAVPARRSPDVESLFRAEGQEVWRVGRVEGGAPAVRLEP